MSLRSSLLGPITSSLLVLLLFLGQRSVLADGIVRAPRQYQGSLEEQSQEAIIIFRAGSETRRSRQDLILRIRVNGDEPLSGFAWVIPFPTRPEVETSENIMFEELFNYVEAKHLSRFKHAKTEGDKVDSAIRPNVQLLSREVVGKYDVAIVQETASGGLGDWLVQENYQPLTGGERIIDFYAKKKYVFACIKVDEAQLSSTGSADLHPLRFRFTSNGRDAIYFPMRLSAIQESTFDINLYIFHRSWINASLNHFGFHHRGFRLAYRDWDSPSCIPNGGKSYSAPDDDPFLSDFSHLFPTFKRFMQSNYPGEQFYLTQLRGDQFAPDFIRDWKDDLWLFPHYRNRKMIPYDVRNNGPAGAAWEGLDPQPTGNPTGGERKPPKSKSNIIVYLTIAIIAALTGTAIGFLIANRRRNSRPEGPA